MAKKVFFDTLRSIAYGSISASYAAVGSALTVEGRIICITNNTDADMIISDDNTNATGKLILAKGTYKLFDMTANLDPNYDDGLFIGKGTVFYVKQLSGPSSGAVYIEIIYGQ